MSKPAREGKPAIARIGGPIAFYALAITLIFSVVWFLRGQSQTLYERMALQGTEFQALTLASMRQLYSSDRKARFQSHGVEVSDLHGEREKSIPLPATLFMEIGEAVAVKRPGARILLLSDYPFPTRKDRPPLDQFEREALQALRTSPDQPFYRFEDYEGRPSLRYAVADRMNASCVACHNSRPDSPKRDWREGDVRGLVEIVRPLDQAVASARAAESGTFKVLTVLALVVPLLAWLVMRRFWTEHDSAANLRAAIVKIAAIIAVCEAIVVCLTAGMGNLPGWLEALLSAAALTAIAAPAIYYRAIRPLSAELTANVAALCMQTQRLLESEQRLRLIVDSALDAVVAMNAQGRVTGWNARAEQIFGYTHDEAVGRRLSELIIPEELRAAHEQGVARYLASGKASLLGRPLEVPALCKDGKRVSVELAINAIRTTTEVWFSAFLRDITERKALEEARAQAHSAAEAASRSKSEFLANMSHEIRTPMTAILGYADLLADDEETAQDSRRRSELVGIIRRNGEHLLGIINDILDLSKVEAGKMLVESIPCSPAQLIEDISSLMRVKVAAKGIAWEVEYETPLPETIQSDPARLRQILVNLVGNAIKFTEVGGVRLVCRLLDEENPRLGIRRRGYWRGDDDQAASVLVSALRAGQFIGDTRFWRHRAGAGDQ